MNTPGIFATVSASAFGLCLLLSLVHEDGKRTRERWIIGDCNSMQMFRAGIVVYDCKKRAAAT